MAVISNILLAFLTFLVLVSVFVPPSFSPYFPLSGFLFPYLMGAHVLFMVYWVWRFKKFVWISVGCLLLSWPSLTDFVQWNNAYYEQDERDWVIISYNIHHTREIRSLKAASHWDEEIRGWHQLLKSYPQLDVVCFQENTQGDVHPLPMTEELKYHHRCKPRGPSILSRFPIVHTGCIDFGNGVNGAIYADIKGKGAQFRIYNVHLQSNQVSDITQPFLNEDEMSKGQNIQKIKKIFRLYLETADKRSKQLEVLLSHAEESPYPVIIAGDFNEGPQSYIYRQLQKGYTDTFKEKGRGISSTYAGNLPFLRIDHIFHDAHWETKHHQVRQLSFSDHYPVAACLDFQETEASR
jgi:exonuclease III